MSCDCQIENRDHGVACPLCGEWYDCEPPLEEKRQAERARERNLRDMQAVRGPSELPG